MVAENDVKLCSPLNRKSSIMYEIRIYDATHDGEAGRFFLDKGKYSIVNTISEVVVLFYH